MHSAPSEAPALIRANEAAALLGVSTRVLYEWVTRGILPASSVIRVGRSVYFSRARLLEWAAGGGSVANVQRLDTTPPATVR